MSAILLTNDLMVSSQLSGAAERAGVKLITVGSPDALIEQASGCRLVIFDLNQPGLELASLVPRLKACQPPPTLLAFGSHVHEALLSWAAAAGCDRVVTRGQFHRHAEAIFKELA